ncbi:MAG: hypothetical protein CO108_15950 [Deltaproteobacteria bacterium CG_4_9_14_3_um_filter_63_12]|nr:MAG: hypothetical protein COW42_11565 [Deltaproteobacteria bacterium CG17_big_fil_post_rev_8_21_14_2_50_63_7]PJB39937.1 MAG: hypothetical protein CO108_15950 [Deltaproteobacteria bacterium CG_4_9_14_3_um_filter_63_12]
MTQNLALRWLDFSIFQVERALVVAALVLMSLMIFLEMLHLALMSDESKLAEFFVNMSNKFAETPMSPDGVVAFSGWVVRIEFILFLLLCYGAVATRLKGRSHVVKLAGAAVVFGVLYGYAEVVRSQPSELAYTLLLVATLVYAVGAWLMAPRDSAKAVELRHERFGVAVAIAAISPLLLYLFHRLPEDYSFAQHRALFLLLWVGFLGASMATYQKSHLRIDFVRKFVRGRRASRFYGAASNGLALLFTLVLFTLAYDYVFNAETGMKTIRSAEGAVPDWLKVLALPVSMAMMCLRLFFQMLEDLVLGVLNKEKS